MSNLTIHEKTIRLMSNKYIGNYFINKIKEKDRSDTDQNLIYKARLFSLLRLFDYSESGFELTLSEEQIQQFFNVFTEEQMNIVHDKLVSKTVEFI